MNKWITLMLGCAISGSTAANAQGIENLRIDKFPDLIENKDSQAPARTPDKVVNDDKELGSKMWAVDNLAGDKDPGFVYFYEKNTTELHKTGIIKPWEEDELRRWNMSASTFHNGKYLGYLYFRYDLGYNYVKNFVEVDLENGTWNSLRDMSEMNGDWNYMEAMTSDPKTGKLIGLGRDMDAVSSGIFEINPETGEYTLLHDLAEYYYTIAYDREGTLWAVRWKYNADGDITGTLLMTLDEENGYAETNVKEMKKDGKAAILYGQSQNCMYFHPKTGVLFMGATEMIDAYTVKTYLCTVNTETAAIENTSTFGWSGDSVTGLYIPGTAPDSMEGANSVTDISSVYDENGVVTLSWTNPTTTASNGELTELEAVRIYRDGEADENLVATITEGVTVGGKMSWSDTGAPAGLHEYFIVPCRIADEKGVSDSWRAFSGKDAPGKPVNITLVKKDKATLEISWEAAEHGANDGWYDKANTTYTIMRHPDEMEVATGIKETTFTDNTLGEMNSYSYTVYGVTDAGNGTEATTEAILAGKAYKTPYDTDLKTEEEALQWTVVDNNSDGFKFEYVAYEHEQYFYMNSVSQNDDYMISPAISLTAGKDYMVKMRIYYAYPPTDYDPEFCNSLRLTAGKGVTADDQTVVIYENDKFQTETGRYYQTVEVEGKLTPDSDGDWHIAYHNNTVKEDYSQDVRFYGMTIYEILDNDLTALGIDGTTNPTKGVASDYTVKVKNIGGNEAGSYKVQVVRIDGNNQVVLGETAVNEPLQPEATAEIVVAATPDVDGAAEIAGRVVLEGDMDNGNDTSAAISIEVSPEGTVPFNAIACDEYEGGDTRNGISFLKFHSHMQHYYHPEDFGGYITPGEPIIIHRIALEYDSNTAVTEPFELTVYMGNTDVAGVDGTKAWIPTEELTQVYYNDNLTTLPGQDNLLKLDLDTPFEYNTGGNMILAFVKNGEFAADQFPAIWRTFHDNWESEEMRTLRYETGTEDTPIAGESGNLLPGLPYLHLAISKAAGIEEITLGNGNGIEYAEGILSFNGIDAASVEVYDIAGRMIAAREVAGTSVNVALEDGIYVVKATDRNGNAYTKKISAKN